MSKKNTTPLVQSPQMAEYLAHQEKIANLKNHATQLEGLIASKQEEIAEANARIPDLSHLTSLRQESHADLAMGQVTEAEVAALDSEIATKKAEHAKISSSAKQITEAADHAIAGLNRRLDNVRREITELTDLKFNQRIVRAVLMDHADTLGEEYLAAANQLKTLYMRLMAVSGLLRTQGMPVGIAAHCSGTFEIPSFNLAGHKPHEMPSWPGNLFLAHVQPANVFQSATDEEREFLHAAGLDCV